MFSPEKTSLLLFFGSRGFNSFGIPTVKAARNISLITVVKLEEEGEEEKNTFAGNHASTAEGVLEHHSNRGVSENWEFLFFVAQKTFSQRWPWRASVVRTFSVRRERRILKCEPHANLRWQAPRIISALPRGRFSKIARADRCLLHAC